MSRADPRQRGDTTFGPESERIGILDFVQYAESTLGPGGSFKSVAQKFRADWEKLPQRQRKSVENEFSLDGVLAQSNTILGDGNLLQELNSSYNQHPTQVVDLPQPESDPAASALLETFARIPLKHWPPPSGAQWHMSRPRPFDQNILHEIKLSDKPNSATETDTLLTITFLSPRAKSLKSNTGWQAHMGYKRDAVFAFLGSQSLLDVFDAVPCLSKDIPLEIIENGEIKGFNMDKRFVANGGIVINGTAYGSGTGEWASDILKLCEENSLDTITACGPPLKEVRLDQLTIRLHSAYWLIHQGNCEHLLIIEQIRLRHPSDPSSNYPIQVLLAPRQHTLCKICSRIAADLAVNGDVRLGDSPCLVCTSCWSEFGGGEGVMVVPLAASGE